MAVGSIADVKRGMTLEEFYVWLANNGTEIDPVVLFKMFWPGAVLYREQRWIMRSVWDNVETIVPAANELGKDFTAGAIVPLFFITRYPCRIVTTSATDSHLDILWGEINRFMKNSVIPLISDRGGPLALNHHHIRRTYNGDKDDISFIRGVVTRPNRGESLQGAHAGDDPFLVLQKLAEGKGGGDDYPRTMMVGDESSGLDDIVFTMADSWADRKFYFGNTWNCQNYFRRSVDGDPSKGDKGGDIPDANNPGKFLRKVIHLDCEVSPNIRRARAQLARGEKPTNEIIIPGVKTWAKLCEDEIKLDEIQKCVKLHARFYKGKEIYLFPEDSLYAAIAYAKTLSNQKRVAIAMGIDSAEGGDSTVWTIIDGNGIIEQKAEKTHDTADIVDITIDFIRQYNLPHEDVLFDRGGGGLEHVHQLRRRGFDVRSVGFGESVKDPHNVRKTSSIKNPVRSRVQQDEFGYAYKNRRAEIYGVMSGVVCQGDFGIPQNCSELIRQLKLIPKKFDSEGRLYIPPKSKPNDSYTGQTLLQLLGCSPDEADSLGLATYVMIRRPSRITVGAI